jgi:hypothetical protein
VSRARKLPPIVDYSDEVTDEHLQRIRELVGDPNIGNAEEVSESGW